MTIRTALLVAVICILSGCWNGDNPHISLGSVSIGRQMMDLKAALESGSMSQIEYDETKKTLLSINVVCAATDEDD